MRNRTKCPGEPAEKKGRDNLNHHWVNEQINTSVSITQGFMLKSVRDIPFTEKTCNYNSHNQNS